MSRADRYSQFNEDFDKRFELRISHYDNLRRGYHEQLEFGTNKSVPLPQHTAEDVVELMHLAVDLNDKAWFDDLHKRYTLILSAERLRRKLNDTN